jgi:hypothetical protein
MADSHQPESDAFSSTIEATPPLAPLLEAVLRCQGFTPTLVEDTVILPSGLRLRAELLDTVPLGEHGLRIVTTILASHDEAFPEGLREFQHTGGNDLRDAIGNGFDAWVRTDLVVLEDTLRAKPENCMTMEMQFPGPDGSKDRIRQILLGPTAHCVQHPASDVEHPFCPCCLLTQSFDAFRECIALDRTLGVRLFAARDAEGRSSADCRVNGEDYPLGVDALVSYASGWPECGFEWRKQYVIMRTVQKKEPE